MALFNLAELPHLLTPGLHMMLQEISKRDRSHIDARIEMSYVEDLVEIVVYRRFPLITRWDSDNYGPDKMAVARLAAKRIRKAIGYDKTNGGRPIILARHRMSVRAKEARNGKKRRINRRDPRRR